MMKGSLVYTSFISTKVKYKAKWKAVKEKNPKR